MPETEFYFADADLHRLLNFVFDQGGVIVPDLSQESPDQKEARSISVLLDIIEIGYSQLLFVLHDDWTRFPLIWDTFQKDGRELHFIQQKTGGPTLDLLLSYPKREQSPNVLMASSIGYHAEFWRRDIERLETTPEELKTFYRRIVQFMKANSSLRVTEGKLRRYFVAEAATHELEQGAILGPPFNNDFPS